LFIEKPSVLTLIVVFTIFASCGQQELNNYATKGPVAAQPRFVINQVGCLKDAKNLQPKILIMGDSQMSRGRDCHKLEDVIGSYTASRNIKNVAKHSTKMTSHSSNGGPIPQQYIPGNWDKLIIAGGGNDLWGSNCTDKSCLKQKIAEIEASYVEFVETNSIEYSKIIFVYPTKVSSKAPNSLKRLVSTGAGGMLKAMFVRLEKRFTGSKYVDLSDVIGVHNPRFWDKDGYHPSEAAYEKLGQKLILDGLL